MKHQNKIKKIKFQIQFNEKVIMEKTQQLEQLTESNRELQQKLAFQVPLWDETMAQVDLASA